MTKHPNYRKAVTPEIRQKIGKMGIVAHKTRFLRCVDEPGLHRAVCACGWSIQGELEHVQPRATTHNLDGELPTREPPLRRMGFVSGLPDKD